MENGNWKTVGGLDVFIPPWWPPSLVIVGQVRTRSGDWVLTNWCAFSGFNRGTRTKWPKSDWNLDLSEYKKLPLYQPLPPVADSPPPPPGWAF